LVQRSLVLTHFSPSGLWAIFVAGQERVAPRCQTPQGLLAEGGLVIEAASAEAIIK